MILFKKKAFFGIIQKGNEEKKYFFCKNVNCSKKINVFNLNLFILIIKLIKMSSFLKSKKFSVLSSRESVDCLGDSSHDGQLKEKDHEIERLIGLNTDLHIKLEKALNDIIVKESLNKSSPDKYKDAMELKMRSECDRKLEEMKQKYERLYLRTRKTLREKEKECLIMEDEMKSNRMLVDSLSKEHSEFQKQLINLKKELDVYKEKESLIEEQKKDIFEEKNQIFRDKENEIQRKNKEIEDLKKLVEENSEKNAKYEKEKTEFEEEKKDLEKVKELIMKRKDSLLAFKKVNIEKELDCYKEELEKMKQSKTLMEIKKNNEISTLSEENKELTTKLQMIQNKMMNFDDNTDLHATEMDLEIAYRFLNEGKTPKIQKLSVFLMGKELETCDYLKLIDKQKSIITENGIEKKLNFKEIYSNWEETISKLSEKIIITESIFGKCWIFYGAKSNFLTQIIRIFLIF